MIIFCCHVADIYCNNYNIEMLAAVGNKQHMVTKLWEAKAAASCW